MTMPHPEEAAYGFGAPATRQPYPPVPSPDAWWVREPPLLPDGWDTSAPPQPSGAWHSGEPLPSPDGWYVQEPHWSRDDWYVHQPPAYPSAPHPSPWPGRPASSDLETYPPHQPADAYAHQPPPDTWDTPVPPQPSGIWYSHEPLPSPDGWYVQEPQAYAPAPSAHEWTAGSGEEDFGTPLPPQSAPEAEPAPSERGETSPSRRAGARRAAAPGAGSGRRRAARRPTGAGRRRKRSPAAHAARAASTVLVTSGLAMVLFVVHQVWWTNVQARAEADEALSKLERTWSDEAPDSQTEDGAGEFAPGEGFAIIRIPKLDLAFPIAEGVGLEQVLDKGLVGHYPGTGMPADSVGNFVLAAHRNTHGEPFREIGRLAPGDRIVVETATVSYGYEVAGRIPETPPTDVSVLRLIPGGSPFSESGRYITLTTCTPEFSTRGRLIVFGKLVEERPRARM